MVSGERPTMVSKSTPALSHVQLLAMFSPTCASFSVFGEDSEISVTERYAKQLASLYGA